MRRAASLRLSGSSKRATGYREAHFVEFEQRSGVGYLSWR